MNLEENVPVKIGRFRLLAGILIAVLIFAVGGVGGYWVRSRQQQSLPTTLQTSPRPSWLLTAPPVQHFSSTPTIAPSQTDPTSNWKTYRDPQGLFSIKYPSAPHVKVQYMKDHSPTQLLTNVEIWSSFAPGSEMGNTVSFDLSISVIDNVVNHSTTEKVIQTVLPQACANTLKPYHNGEIAGFDYIACFESTLNGIERQEFIEYITEDKIYEFTFNTEGELTSGDTRTLIDQILSTFKFNFH